MTSLRRWTRTVVVLAASWLAAGCYTYRLVEQPAPGASVRAALTVEGAVRQSELLGEPVRSLSGKFVSSDNSSVALDIVTSASRGTFNNIVLRDTLSIPTDQVVALEQREISWLRTGGVAAAVAAVGVIAISSLTSGGSEIDGGGPPPPTFDGIRIPFFTIGR